MSTVEVEETPVVEVSTNAEAEVTPTTTEKVLSAPSSAVETPAETDQTTEVKTEEPVATEPVPVEQVTESAEEKPAEEAKVDEEQPTESKEEEAVEGKAMVAEEEAVPPAVEEAQVEVVKGEA